MKATQHLLLWLFLLCGYMAPAQVQWYQNQDGNNPPPNGTFGSCAKNFTPNSFIACYQWTSNNEEYTWKISKSHINGSEQKRFFVSGAWASVDVKIGRYNTVYVLVKTFPTGDNAGIKVFKLDSNLVVKATRQIILPNSFSIYNINAFEIDNSDNLYMAGDGQYPIGPDLFPASFVLKTDKNLNIKWKNVDSSATSFVRLHVESSGKVVIIEDYYNFFPELKIRKYNSNGALVSTRSFVTDAGRFNVLSRLDNNDNLLLYGGKSIDDTAQAIYMYKLSRNTGNVQFNKTYFTTMGIQLHDLTLDDDGRIFTLVSQYEASGEQRSLISRINPSNGSLLWNKVYQYTTDSCVLGRLIVNDDDRFFVLGERRNSSFLSRGVVLRIKKNGQQDNGYNGPDSVTYQRSHSLVDGLTDRSGQLITIGNTNDFDPNTYNSSYFRAFAARFGESRNNHGCDNKGAAGPEEFITATAAEKKEEAETMQVMKLIIYPNPVQDELAVSNINKEEFDQLGVFNMQGAMVLRQPVKNTSMRLDISSLTDGVYLLVLRSSVTMKEKSVKFVVSK